MKKIKAEITLDQVNELRTAIVSLLAGLECQSELHYFVAYSLRTAYNACIKAETKLLIEDKKTAYIVFTTVELIALNKILQVDYTYKSQTVYTFLLSILNHLPINCN